MLYAVQSGDIGNGEKERNGPSGFVYLAAEASVTLSPASARVRRKLIEIARSGTVIGYGELMSTCGIENRFLLSEQLGEVSDDCSERGEPLLSALGVGKETMTPAGGFFAKATQHAGYNGSEDEADQIRWWGTYLTKVHNYWRHRSNDEGAR